MNRDDNLRHLQSSSEEWDILIIGGGATGVGAAVDAASRGYKTLLLEQHDFGKGTSSRSTKLAHGGVRYLQQANISLVFGALHERGIMRENAPHLVEDQVFIIPNYRWWDTGFYGIGLTMYDLLAGRWSFGRSRVLSRRRTIEHLPTIETKGLRAGVLYHDGQFDDARLIINMAQTATEHGAVMMNYMKVTGLLKTDGLVRGVTAVDQETGISSELRAKVVVNATGPFTDTVRAFDDESARPLISPSQGVHIVLDRSFLPGTSAIMVPKTDDGRVLFAIPWQNVVVVGTTDTPITGTALEPRPLKEEIDFLLDHAARYLSKDPTAEDVLSVFVGIRPLVKSSDSKSTAALSRDHTLQVSPSGMVTITGGKWTTYRKMAEDTVNHAARVAKLDARPCVTRTLRLHGAHPTPHEFAELSPYGSDAPALRKLLHDDPKLAKRLHPERPYLAAQVVWAVRHEMARTVEDVLSRRTRALITGAHFSIEMAPAVARIMAAELGYDAQWESNQVALYTELARGYMLTSPEAASLKPSAAEGDAKSPAAEVRALA